MFVKNVPFSANNDDLRNCMEQFGEVLYALICIDPVTEHSKGTGFVKFQVCTMLCVLVVFCFFLKCLCHLFAMPPLTFANHIKIYIISGILWRLLGCLQLIVPLKGVSLTGDSDNNIY